MIHHQGTKVRSTRTSSSDPAVRCSCSCFMSSEFMSHFCRMIVDGCADRNNSSSRSTWISSKKHCNTATCLSSYHSLKEDGSGRACAAWKQPIGFASKHRTECAMEGHCPHLCCQVWAHGFSKPTPLTLLWRNARGADMTFNGKAHFGMQTTS